MEKSFLVFPSILYANFIDTKWTVTGYLGELWFAEEEDIIGKQQEFFKGWSDGIFYSCNYGGQSATYNSYTIREFLDNREFFLVNQEKAFANVFAALAASAVKCSNKGLGAVSSFLDAFAEDPFFPTRDTGLSKILQ